MSKQPVAGVAESRHDIAVVVEMGADRRRVDRNVRVVRIDGLPSFRRRQQADIADRSHPALFDALDHHDCRMPGGRIGSRTNTSRSEMSTGSLQ